MPSQFRTTSTIRNPNALGIRAPTVVPFEIQTGFQMVWPFENQTLKSLVFRWIRYLGVQYSDGHNILEHVRHVSSRYFNDSAILPVFDVSQLLEPDVKSLDQVLPVVSLLRELLSVGVKSLGFRVQSFLEFIFNVRLSIQDASLIQWMPYRLTKNCILSHLQCYEIKET